MSISGTVHSPDKFLVKDFWWIDDDNDGGADDDDDDDDGGDGCLLVVSCDGDFGRATGIILAVACSLVASLVVMWMFGLGGATGCGDEGCVVDDDISSLSNENASSTWTSPWK
jgi:hypothetical protein